MNTTEGKFLLLGSNLGDRLANLQKSIDLLRLADITILRSSAIYESEPWGIREQPVFYNCVVEIATTRSADELLQLCLSIEIKMGRERVRKWGERLIDIDILYFDQQILNHDELKLPHLGIPERRFTLVPLVEIAPNFIHPLFHKSQSELLEACPDQLNCFPIADQLSL